MTTPKVTTDMVGTWLDGCHGWHNGYRVVDRASEYGFVVPPEYTDALEWYRTSYGGWVPGEGRVSESQAQTWHELIMGQGELSDQATEYLDSLAPAGYEFYWDAGELSLVESWQVCENGCTEETRCFYHRDEDDA